MKSLRGQVVLITGAAGGFGQSLTRQLLPLGARLLLADMDASVLCERTRLLLKQAGLDAHADQVLAYMAADLATADGADELARQALAIAPEIDLLVNNAGIGMAGHFVDIPRVRWETLMQVNLLAPMRLTSLILPGMLARRRGHIVNISSSAGLIGTPDLSPYSTAKFGLRGFSDALARELKPAGIDVTAIFPYFARTPILDAERFGMEPGRALPDYFITSADFVMEQLVRGIQRRRRHVYPGFMPRTINLLTRIAPAFPTLIL